MKLKSKMPCIYAAQSISTRRMYIGQSKPGLSKRKRDHLRDRFTRDDKFHLALRDLGPEDFVWEILYVIEDSSLDSNQIKEILSKKERFYIKKFNSIEKGYNTIWGSSGAKGKYKTLKEKREAYNKSRREKRKNMSLEEKQQHKEKIKNYRENSDYKIKQSIRANKRRMNESSEKREVRLKRRRERQSIVTNRRRNRKAKMSIEELNAYKEYKKQKKIIRDSKLTPKEKELKRVQAKIRRKKREQLKLLKVEISKC